MKNVDDLIPYINNPRNNDAAVDAVASSIKHFGFKVPIVVDKFNEVVNGHTRLKAANKLGLEEVPCIIADDLTDKQIKAFRLADNKVSELAEWDFELLEAELGLLDFDMEQFGFDEVLNDINIDDLWDEAPQKEKEEEEAKKLSWGDKAVEITGEEEEALTNKLYEFNSLDLDTTFVRWLLGEWGENEVDVSRF